MAPAPITNCDAHGLQITFATANFNCNGRMNSITHEDHFHRYQYHPPNVTPTGTWIIFSNANLNCNPSKDTITQECHSRKYKYHPPTITPGPLHDVCQRQRHLWHTNCNSTAICIICGKDSNCHPSTNSITQEYYTQRY